jgi:hypothetical protein
MLSVEILIRELKVIVVHGSERQSWLSKFEMPPNSLRYLLVGGRG